AVLALVLLGLSLALFLIQRRLVARRSFVTMSGKGEGGTRIALPRALTAIAAALTLPWVVLAVVVYAMILSGGFFEKWGLNHALTLRHYVTAFGVERGADAMRLTGGAWSSMLTTLEIAIVSAPLTASF